MTLSTPEEFQEIISSTKRPPAYLTPLSPQALVNVLTTVKYNSEVF